MFSVEKSGKIKKQIDRYFLPLEINPNLILDLIRVEQKKNNSPSKIRQETMSKISQETKRLELLKVTGRELNSNFTPFNIKTKTVNRESKLSPKKQVYKYRIQQILSEPLESIVETISKDPDSYLFSRELEQFHKYKSAYASEGQLKVQKINQISLFTEANKEVNYKEHFENIIMSNPALYKKMLIAYHKIENEKIQKISSCEKREKRVSLSEAIITKRVPKAYKKIPFTNQKQMSQIEMKRLNNFIQYRQFQMVINLSNKIVVFPENDVQYKAYICKGNNGILVKSIIKSRPWWTLRSSTDIENCSLVWTQWKKTKLTNSLPSKQLRNEKASFYATNYYDRINHQENQKQDISKLAKTDSKVATKNEFFGFNSQFFDQKHSQIARIANIDKILSEKYINEYQSDSSYYSFTKKINQKKFEQISKRYLPSSPSYYCYNQNMRPKQKNPSLILNHVPGCLQLHSKKLLFQNMKKYYEKNNKQVFDYLPETHLIKSGLQDPNFQAFLSRFESLQAQKNDVNLKTKTKNIWICKPGENSNRGNGITVVSTLDEIRSLVKSMNGHKRSLIIQKYMQSPYLYNKRKFDIRCYLLITTVNGILKGYFFNEGYIRTTSKEYNLKNLDNKFIHLTNDAIQKKGEQYGKFESCNKVSFAQFEKYLDGIDSNEVQKFLEAKKKLKEMASQIVLAVAGKLNPARKQFCFQLFGLDFMLDAKMKPFLIEANSNPCLQVDGTVLSKIIPNLIQNTIRVAIDPIFPPPYSESWKSTRYSPGNCFQQNKFEIIYDSLEDPNLRENTFRIQDLKEMQEQQEECEKQTQNQFQ